MKKQELAKRMHENEVKQKIERVLSVNTDALASRFWFFHKIEKKEIESHPLTRFKTIYCAESGMALGFRSAEYLNALVQIHGIEKAETCLYIESLRTYNHLFAYELIGETLQTALLQEPVFFFMRALAVYGGERRKENLSTLDNLQEQYKGVERKARIFRAISVGLHEKTLQIETLLTACELLRRYLAIAGKHAQTDSLTFILEILAREDTITDKIFSRVNAIIQETLSSTIRRVKEILEKRNRKPSKNATTLISDVRQEIGGLSAWQALGKTDNFHSADEATRAVLECLGIDLVMNRPSNQAVTRNRIADMKQKEKALKKAEKERQEKTAYQGKTRSAPANLAAQIKFG